MVELQTTQVATTIVLSLQYSAAHSIVINYLELQALYGQMQGTVYLDVEAYFTKGVVDIQSKHICTLLSTLYIHGSEDTIQRESPLILRL